MAVALLLSVALQVVVIRDVTIIDGAPATARRRQDVVVDGGRIVAARPTGGALPRDARIIDGRTRYLLPGFIDTHAHVAFGPVTLTKDGATPVMRFTYDHDVSLHTLRTLLAFGVTMVRNPAGPADHAVALRDSLERGQLTGPRVRTAGEVIDVIVTEGMGRAVKTPDEMRAEVRRQAALGVDMVKLYAGLSAPLVAAGVEEAHQLGIRAITHTMFTSWTDAANAGVDGIVHIVPGSPQLIAPDQRKAYLQSMRGTQFMAQWFRYADTASTEIRAMTEALVRRGVWLDPTLITFDRMFRGNLPDVRDGPDLQYAAPLIRENWRTFDLAVGWTPADFADAASLWPKVEAFVRHLYRAGVKLTVGTDANNPFTPPGISFHREMALLVRAGIPVADVLGMATSGGAQSMGLEGEIGAIAAGKRADLVLLDADPLADIANTQRVGLVMLGGRTFVPRDLLNR